MSDLTDFERGVREGVEAMYYYFLNVDEQAIHEELPVPLLDSHKAGAIADALETEERRTLRNA